MKASPLSRLELPARICNPLDRHLPQLKALRLPGYLEYDLRLYDLGLSGRVHNSLVRQGVATIGILSFLSDEQLASLINFGEGSLREVKERLAAFWETLPPAALGHSPRMEARMAARMRAWQRTPWRPSPIRPDAPEPYPGADGHEAPEPETPEALAYVRDLLVPRDLRDDLASLEVAVDELPVPWALPHAQMWRRPGGPATLRDLFAYYAGCHIHPLAPCSLTAENLRRALAAYLGMVRAALLALRFPAEHMNSGPRARRFSVLVSLDRVPAQRLRLYDLLALLCLYLSGRQIAALVLRHGLKDGELLTLAEIGRIGGLSREGVRQLTKKGEAMLASASPRVKKDVADLLRDIVRPLFEGRSGGIDLIEMADHLHSDERVGPLSAPDALWFLIEHTGALVDLGLAGYVWPARVGDEGEQSAVSSQHSAADS